MKFWNEKSKFGLHTSKNKTKILAKEVFSIFYSQRKQAPEVHFSVTETNFVRSFLQKLNLWTLNIDKVELCDDTAGSRLILREQISPDSRLGLNFVWKLSNEAAAATTAISPPRSPPQIPGVSHSDANCKWKTC